MSQTYGSPTNWDSIDPERLRIAQTAIAQTLHTLGSAGGASKWMRVAVARVIVKRVQGGENDVDRLKTCALKDLAWKGMRPPER